MATKKKILCQRGLLGKTSSKFCHILKGKKEKKEKKGQKSPYLGNEQDSLKILLSSFSLQKETGDYTYPYTYILIARAVT